MQEVNFLDLLNDYEKNFCNKRCLITTSYTNKPLEVVFDKLDLYHLFGIHKLSNIRAMKWVELVNNNKFSLSAYKSKDINEILPRIESYYFLHDVFFKNNVNVLVLGKDIKSNTMKLSIVFYKEDDKSKVVVLGLRKDSRDKYRPVTLHVSRNNKYKSYRHTTIKFVQWI